MTLHIGMVGLGRMGGPMARNLAAQRGTRINQFTTAVFDLVEHYPKLKARYFDAADDILRSETFPGLWLDPAALLRRDRKRLLGVLREGLRSPEHAAFAARLGS